MELSFEQLGFLTFDEFFRAARSLVDNRQYLHYTGDNPR